VSDLDDPAEEGRSPEQGRGKVRKAPTAFRTISEVADELHIPQHVLRFWETKFPQVKPLKRGGGRRYYRPHDLALLRRISDLLYIQGYTIKGVQRLLREGPSRFSEEAPASETVFEDVDEMVEGEIDLSQASDEDLERMTRESGPDTEQDPAELRAEAIGQEVERLRATLRETLTALESLRTMLR
jgi:DNA-binding transcriptional MerR regulator